MFCKLPAIVRKRSTRTIVCVLLGLSLAFTLFGSANDYTGRKSVHFITDGQARRTHFAVIFQFISKHEDWPTSKLGSWLFKYETIVTPQNRSFSILVWKYWNWLSARHVNRYGSKGHDPLEGCSVKNCIFTGEDDKLATADAVVVHLQHGDVPNLDHRNPLQRWIFLSDESPYNAFSLARKQVKLKDLANMFNWSMTYRSDADIPVPYGRTVVLREPIFRTNDLSALTEIIPNWKKKRRDVLATILISNCAVQFRMDFLKELMKYIHIDIFGQCSDKEANKRRCPGHFRSDCEPISEYLFYLVLENSICHEYLTEKIWYHAYMKGAIPVIMGPSLSDCENLLPPHSFIYISKQNDTFDVETLARYIISLTENDDSLLALHQWRNNFKVLNEHGYFGTQSYHLCRVCEAMNYNDAAVKVYSEKDLRWFLDPNLMCINKM